MGYLKEDLVNNGNLNYLRTIANDYFPSIKAVLRKRGVKHIHLSEPEIRKLYVETIGKAAKVCTCGRKFLNPKKSMKYCGKPCATEAQIGRLHNYTEEQLAKRSKQSLDRWASKSEVERREWGKNISRGIRSDPQKYARQVKNVRKASLKRKHLKEDTKPELLMKRILIDLDQYFIHPFPVWGIAHGYVADFCLPNLNLIIETDGIYWHADPRIYKATDRIKDKTAQEVWDTDRIRQGELEIEGYTVLRFWDGEFDKRSVQEAILNM